MTKRWLFLAVLLGLLAGRFLNLALESTLTTPWAWAKQSSTYAKALAAYKDRKLNKALRLAKQAVHEAPNNVNTHVLLGELYYLRQDLRRAKKSWEKALKLAPNNKKIQQLLAKLGREETVEKTLKRSDTHPFVLRFASQQTSVDLSALKQTLRDAYRKIGQDFEHFPEHSITVLLYPEADFAKVKQLGHNVGGVYDGKIRLPLKGRQTTSRELKRILWHEYTHAVVHDLSKGRCPRWFNEGIATQQEARVVPVDVRVARAAFAQEKLPSWRTLWGTGTAGYKQGVAQLNYQTAFLVVRYLVKRWSWRDLSKLLKRLGEGTPFQQALKAQYRSDPETLEHDWLQWLKREL